ncbi:type VI secretion protein, partial [Streptomyces sp. NPDC004031]
MAAQKREQNGGGLPDGLVVGIIAFLLGVTLLVWTATGIAGLLAHGSWPAGLHFTRTPRAMRALVGQPHDIPAAWPDAEAGGLSGPGLFWGIFIGQFMVLFTVAVWTMNVTAQLRGKGRRPVPRPVPVAAAAEPGPAPEPVAGPAEAPADVPAPRRRGRA